MNDSISENIKYLLNNFIVVKDYDREKYYKIKKNQVFIRDFVSKNLGSNLIIKENFIKLEKIPSFAKAKLGIRDFENVPMACRLVARSGTPLSSNARTSCASPCAYISSTRRSMRA